MHSLQCVLPGSSWKRPDGQSRHAREPSSGWYVPRLQGVSRPSLHEWASLHLAQHLFASTQSDVLVPLKKVPASHSDAAGLRLPSAQNWSMGHSSHSVAPGAPW